MFKNVIIISIDSLRADGINYNRDLIYGKGNHNPIKTPNLDKFAKKGTSFINAYSTNTYTTSAHASLFTGEYPPTHKIRSFVNFNQKLNPVVKTIAEELDEKGFQTFFYSDVKELFSGMNIWRGFNIKTYGKIDWLFNSISDLKKDRNFIFIHVFDVHEPYLFIEDKNTNKNENVDYYKNVNVIRKILGINSKLIQEKHPHQGWYSIRKAIENNTFNEKDILQKYYELGIEKFDKKRFPIIINKLYQAGFNENNSLIIILGDHGEGESSFIEIGKFRHAGHLNEEIIRIPLIMNLKMNKNKLTSIKNLKKIILDNKYRRTYSNKYIYSETWQQKYWTKEKKTILKKQEAFISQRGIILANKEKIVLSGEPEFTQSDLLKLSNKKFIIKLYRSIFARYEDTEGLNYHLEKLEKKQITRSGLLKMFIQSNEAKLRKPWSVYKISSLNDIEISRKNNHKALTEKLLLNKNTKSLQNYLFKKIDIDYQKKYGLGDHKMISYSQNQEDVILENIFSDVFNGFYVDIGAADPIINSVTKHFYNKGWNGLNVEPNDIFAHKLRNDRLRDITICAGISNREEKIPFYICNSIPEWSTFSKENSKIHITNGAKFITKTKQTLPLRSIFKKYVSRTIHFLKIDVEGYEKEVIFSNDWSKFRPLVIIIESNNFITWEKYILNKKYKFALFDGLNRYYIRSDQKKLLSKIKTAVNIFSKYKLYNQIQCEQNLIHKSERVLKLENELQIKKANINTTIANMNSTIKEKNDLIEKLKVELKQIKSSKVYSILHIIKKNPLTYIKSLLSR